MRTLPGRLTGASKRSGPCYHLQELRVCSPHPCLQQGCRPSLSVACRAVSGLLPPFISETVKYSSHYFPFSHAGKPCFPSLSSQLPLFLQASAPNSTSWEKLPSTVQIRRCFHIHIVLRSPRISLRLHVVLKGLRKPRSCYTRGYSLLEQNTSSISRGRKSMRQSPEETRQEFPRSCSSWSPRGHAWTGTSGFRQGAVIWSYDAHVTGLSHWSSRPSEEKQVFIISRVVHRNSAVSSMQQDPQHGRNYQNISRAGFSEANLENLCHRIGPSREGNVRGVSKLARWVNPFYPHIHTCVCMYTYLFIMVQNCQPSIYFAQLIFIIL